jgi:hypothetical protein
MQLSGGMRDGQSIHWYSPINPHYANAEQSSYHLAYHQGPVQYSRLRLHTKKVVSSLSIHHLPLILNRGFLLKVTESCWYCLSWIITFMCLWWNIAWKLKMKIYQFVKSHVPQQNVWRKLAQWYKVWRQQWRTTQSTTESARRNGKEQYKS